ncbi:MAG: serine O-acetyltransferase [Myxococcota bacterium]
MGRVPTRHRELVEAIDAVVDSYDGTKEIDSLESAAMPNRRAVVEAFKHLQAALFVGFYASRPLSAGNLRLVLAEHLHPAYELLVEQIDRAATYEARRGRPPEGYGEGWSEAAVLTLYRRIPQMRRCLAADVTAAYRGDPAAGSVEEVVFSYPSTEAITAHRVAKVLYDLGVPLVPRIVAEYAHFETGIDIHPGATIGSDFFVDHGTATVIGETARIGDRVKIYHGVTLGALSAERGRREAAAGRPRHPKIEDDVTIYSGATILGGDTVIGAGSVIGGNVWLTRSVAPGSKIFGGRRSGSDEVGDATANHDVAVVIGGSSRGRSGREAR